MNTEITKSDLRQGMWSYTSIVEELPKDIDDPYESAIQLLLDYINDSDVKLAFKLVRKRYG